MLRDKKRYRLKNIYYVKDRIFMTKFCPNLLDIIIKKSIFLHPIVNTEEKI